MKNKIKRFANGDFHAPQPDIIFPETHIIMRVGEGEKYQGNFSLQNESEGTIRGLVYPSSFRVHCDEQGFDGNPVNISYTYDGTGLVPGHVEHGKFTIVCNGGEYDISFTAIIEKPYVMTRYGKVQSLEDFKKLTYRDSMEAEKLFRSRDFYTILKYEDKRIQALYDNMRKWELDQQAMEEFLVGCKQKEKIFLTLDEESRAFSSLPETRKEILTIKKNTWGYLSIDVRVEGDFLRVDRTRLISDEFIGNSCRLEYFISQEHLHKGNNFGQIILETPYEVLRYEVIVEKESDYDEERRGRTLLFASILKSYLEYEAGRVDVNTWTEETLKKISKLRDGHEKDELYLLVHAHICLIGRRMEEAKWLLESYNYNRFAIGKDVELSSYYLYLTTLLSNDSIGQRRVAEELSRSYMKHPESWMILCMLVNVDAEYKILSERLRVLEKLFYEERTGSLIFYMEAFRCFREKSSSLKKLGMFEVRVLLFAARYKLMTKELALYTANLASQLKDFDKHLYQALVICYKTYPEPMILTAICTLLIKGGCVGNRYFTWFEMAVESEMKIAQLYEYYIETLNEKRFKKPLPRSVYLYFMHGNTLNYLKKAFLYANLITYEDDSSEIYTHYRDEMEAFAWNQLDRRHINEHLRVIYKRFVVERAMNPDRIKALYDVCHSYEITTKVPDMKFIHVVSEDGEITQKAAYTESGAQVFLYSKTDRLVWEGKDGRHYTDTVPYESRRLFYELRYMDLCKKYINSLKLSQQEEAEELTLEVVKKVGMEHYVDSEIMALCSRNIRENNFENDDFLTYVCYELFKRKQYDRAILTYLATYYCGTTVDMKRLWREAREYEVHTHKLAERILTQMLFAEAVFGEVGVFEDYYAEGAYFRLQQAYLAYMSRSYVTEDRKIAKSVIDIICKEYEKGEETIDICKIAVLKYYAGREYGPAIRKTLKKLLQDLCGKQIYFPFFLQYEKEWLIEQQLWDKTLIEYRGQKGSRIMLYYQLQKGDDAESVDYSTEVLTPMYENIYVKKFVLFANETLRYYFKETIDGNAYRSEKEVCVKDVRAGENGRYGRLNDILLSDKEQREKKMREYAQEDLIAAHMFGPEQT